MLSDIDRITKVTLPHHVVQHSMRSLLTIGLILSIQVFGLAQTIRTIAGTGKPENNADHGQGAAVSIGDPFGVELSSDRSLHICEVRNHRLWKLDAKNELTVIAGNGAKGYSGDGGLATKAQLNEPYEIRFDTAGNIYFVEMQNHLVRKVE